MPTYQELAYCQLENNISEDTVGNRQARSSEVFVLWRIPGSESVGDVIPGGIHARLQIAAHASFRPILPQNLIRPSNYGVQARAREATP